MENQLEEFVRLAATGPYDGGLCRSGKYARAAEGRFPKIIKLSPKLSVVRKSELIEHQRMWLAQADAAHAANQKAMADAKAGIRKTPVESARPSPAKLKAA